MEFTNSHLTALLFIGFFTTLMSMIALIAWSLNLNHRKRMELIDRNKYDEAADFSALSSNWKPEYTLGTGLIAGALGLGWTVERLISGDPLDGSIILTFGGIAVLAYYFFARHIDR